MVERWLFRGFGGLLEGFPLFGKPMWWLSYSSSACWFWMVWALCFFF